MWSCALYLRARIKIGVGFVRLRFLARKQAYFERENKEQSVGQYRSRCQEDDAVEAFTLGHMDQGENDHHHSTR